MDLGWAPSLLCEKLIVCCRGVSGVGTVNHYFGVGHYIRPLASLTVVQGQEQEGTNGNVSYQSLKPPTLCWLISLKV